MKNKFLKNAFRTNIILMVFISLVVFALANYVNYRHYKRFDWTQSSIYTLSDKTKNILADLKEPVKIIVFYQPEHSLYGSIENLLNEYSFISNKIELEYVDPDKDVAKTEMLARKFNIEAQNVIVICYKDKYKSVSDFEMVDYDMEKTEKGEEPRIKAFRGEEVITSGILFTLSDKQSKAYFVTGHGEREFGETQNEAGIQKAVERLKRDNLMVDKLALLDKNQIPEDANILIIAGPTKNFVNTEIELLDKYMQQGGKLFVAIDPVYQTGLEDFLKKWGVVLGNNIVVDPGKKMSFLSSANLYIDTYTPHIIVENMKSVATLYNLTRSVDIALEEKNLDGNSLAFTSANGWADVDLNNTEFQFDADKDKQGPISIATAIKSKQEKGMRLVVVGDSDFLTDSQITSMGNGDLFVNSINWLDEREMLVSIGPKSPQNIYLTLNSTQTNQIFIFSVIMLPSLSIIIGAIVIWKRRR